MGNLVFYAMFFVIFLQFTFGAIKYSGVNRTFLSMYRGVFEVSLITVGEDGEPIYPYFGEEILKNNINTYLENNLAKYSIYYTTDIVFLDYKTDGLCLDEYCSKVKVNLSADINYFFKYSNSLVFTVKEGSQNEW